ncbi:transporter substrate-binding domain-containing protein [Halodesulfurarchaeum formicicum]|uniref:Glutamine ABC transporter permease n=1 Tax=Halodesulfurarchaeum formicicum TaxID=1873524 RepID=A0A1J1ACJ6_9EURY|nr:transporter substrate-binding domain-containing protein [Halodesulfurarchaeum formicicum]APE95491.1 glutamine ABC transporter permease [Halodesulfurarchaeum formicicum]
MTQQNRFDRRDFLKATGVAGTLTLTGLAGCSGNGEDGSGTTTAESMEIVAGTAPGFPPFEEKDGGDLVGFDIDLLEAVVEATDYELAGWDEYEFGSLSPALQNDKIDVIAAAMTINDERDESIDFSDPYYDANQAILVANDSGFSPSEMADLEGQTLGAQKGTTGESVVQDTLIPDGIVSEDQYNSYDNYVFAVEDLVNGNIDAVVLDTPVADSFVAEREVSVAFTYETGEQYGFGVREGDSELQTALNDGLATVREDGTYEDLVAKWFK